MDATSGGKCDLGVIQLLAENVFTSQSFIRAI
jgi:hypothetical protein